jgi:hypothetical protein
MMRSGGIVAAALAVALSGGAALGQTTPADPLAPGAGADSGKTAAAPERPDPEKKKPAGHKKASASGRLDVTVHNERSVGLVELRVGPAGAPEQKKVAGPLAFGRKTVIHLQRTKDCLYDIHAHFADDADTDQTGVELCKDKAINLTD